MGVTIGTPDGANIEIRDHVGAENMFIRSTADEVATRRAAGYSPMRNWKAIRSLKARWI